MRTLLMLSFALTTALVSTSAFAADGKPEVKQLIIQPAPKPVVSTLPTRQIAVESPAIGGPVARPQLLSADGPAPAAYAHSVSGDTPRPVRPALPVGRRWGCRPTGGL